jgi:excinuclease ABC subunit C
MLATSIQKIKLPDAPGVYLFKQGKVVLYVGKATSLKDRVRSYFGADLIQTRGPLLVDMIYKADKIDHIKTDSVLEAIILEVNLIKKYQPKYNTKEKDNKSFNYVVITDEDFPRVLIMRGRELLMNQEKSFINTFGPFPNSTQLKEALKIIRKIFPFRDRCVPLSGKLCFNKQIGLCPGVCDGSISKVDYKKIIKNIQLFFEGKKKQILKSLKKEMKSYAKAGEFEKAADVRNKIFALNHIQDVALISASSDRPGSQTHHPALSKAGKGEMRIEAYDAAHLSGTNNVGVMVVIENGEFKKGDYRKFKNNK